MNNLLPIGSVVKIKENTKISLMILGYYLIDKKNNKCYQYAGTVFPSGMTDSTELFLFNHKDIKNIVFKGFENDNSHQTIENLQKEIENDF